MSATPLPSLLLNAARSAAVADGLSPPPQSLSHSITTTNTSDQDEQGKKAEAAAGLTMVANAVGQKAHSSAQSKEAVRGDAQNVLSQMTDNNNNNNNTHNNGSNNGNSLKNKNFYQPNGTSVQAPSSSFLPKNGVSPAMPSTSKPMNPPRSVSNLPPVPPQQSSNTSSSTSSKPASSSSSSSSKPKGPLLRRGKWTAEEENYANRLIQEFKSGLLPLTDGTTLRTFLSKLLNCDPMRISKKFVGSNCIGKQVFRRRTVDINRLTPEHIEQSRKELSELERRFLERVAQTNRVKSNGAVGAVPVADRPKPKLEEETMQSVQTHNPPWLRPPNGFKPGLSKGSLLGTNSRAAAVGREILQRGTSSTLSNSGGGGGGLERKSSKPTLNLSRSHGSAGLLAMIEMQRRKSEQNLIQNAVQNNSTNNLLNAALSSANNGGLSSTAMTQIARNASAARIAGLAASGHSLNSLMLKTGLSRDQLTQLARDQQTTSSHSLSNMMERQSSFDALMSLDFQSLQSIDNLANLIQSGGTAGLQPAVPKSGLKNWESTSSSNLSSLAETRRRLSEGRMGSLIRTLSSGNAGSLNGLAGAHGSGSNATFGNLLQSMQNMGSANSLVGSGNFLVNMLRNDSSTGLTALRMQDGLPQRNSSVDDFLSLVASGDIPHQDPHLLNIPLQSVIQPPQQQQQESSQRQNDSGAPSAALLAQQRLLQAASNGNSSLSNAMLLGLGNNSAASLISQLSSSQRNSAATNAAAAAFAQQQQQARAAQMNMSASALSLAARAQQQLPNNSLKRKHTDDMASQGHPKR